jgi:hypothetical protein
VLVDISKKAGFVKQKNSLFLGCFKNCVLMVAVVFGVEFFADGNMAHFVENHYADYHNQITKPVFRRFINANAGKVDGYNQV